MIRCPICQEAIHVNISIHLHMSWMTALKLWLAGPEASASLLDELRLHVAETTMRRIHPENR